MCLVNQENDSQIGHRQDSLNRTHVFGRDRTAESYHSQCSTDYGHKYNVPTSDHPVALHQKNVEGRANSPACVNWKQNNLRLRD